jgi:hypothetical protein
MPAVAARARQRRINHDLAAIAPGVERSIAHAGSELLEHNKG